jgi:hypothetical protein
MIPAGHHPGPATNVGPAWQHRTVDVTDEHVARIPAGNLRQPREAVGNLWREVERIREEEPPSPADGYWLGVTWTLRWLAEQPLPDLYAPGEPPSWPKSPLRRLLIPLTRGTVIEEITLAAELVNDDSCPADVQLIALAVGETLAWAYYGNPVPPATSYRATG